MSNDDYLRLATVDNFRDVAGTGYATVDGGRVRRGVFYRSNELRISEEDAATLAELGLTAVIDLRSEMEIAQSPDPEVPGAVGLHFDLLGIPMAEVGAARSREEAAHIMGRVYRGFATEQRTRELLGDVLRQLATGGKQLFHCTAGKDRTGWTAALLLHIAGVDDPTIESDYLLTNVLNAASRARTEALIAEHAGPEKVAILEPTLVADIDYLRAAAAAVDSEFGDRGSYLRDGLGLDDEVLGRLRALLRED
ncbi:tyrosine-protein phosphatase [Nocardioides sp. GY 10113]|uniref:tyrosine-protein phosphatase n=1 Tax=Nocardioides sp. GY 10113 TaxID=2569761 RepID=UPI00145829A2|nr:tyrosine-protein phosphatase [Nocardioides sp. GY 10113]